MQIETKKIMTALTDQLLDEMRKEWTRTGAP